MTDRQNTCLGCIHPPDKILGGSIGVAHTQTMKWKITSQGRGALWHWSKKGQCGGNMGLRGAGGASEVCICSQKALSFLSSGSRGWRELIEGRDKTSSTGFEEGKKEPTPKKSHMGQNLANKMLNPNRWLRGRGEQEVHTAIYPLGVGPWRKAGLEFTMQVWQRQKASNCRLRAWDTPTSWMGVWIIYFLKLRKKLLGFCVQRIINYPS